MLLVLLRSAFQRAAASGVAELRRQHIAKLLREREREITDATVELQEVGIGVDTLCSSHVIIFWLMIPFGCVKHCSGCR